MDLAGINVSDFSITCSIYSKICDNCKISGTIFSENANFAKLSTRKHSILKVTGYRRGRGFKCGCYYPSLARYCQYGPESYSHV